MSHPNVRRCGVEIAHALSCDRDQGHYGPHANYGAAVVWHGLAGPLGFVVERSDLWSLLIAVWNEGWTDGECSYLRNIVEEQPDRTRGLELSRKT